MHLSIILLLNFMRKLVVILVLLIVLLFTGGCWNGEYSKEYPFVEGGNLSVVFFDVGQGDSTLIVTPDGVRILVDCGEFEDASIYLLEMNITWIDVLIVTHDHEDHAGGCSDVKEVVGVGKVMTNKNVYSDFSLGLTNTTFLEVIVAYDDYGRFEGENDNSVIFKIGYGNVSLIFMGDCEWKCENELLNSHKKDMDVDVLRVGHHGGKYSSTSAFLAGVSPSAAVISSGKKNKYGHPHNETLERLGSLDVEIYRTDISGNLFFSTDGRKYSFS